MKYVWMRLFDSLVYIALVNTECNHVTSLQTFIDISWANFYIGNSAASGKSPAEIISRWRPLSSEEGKYHAAPGISFPFHPINSF